MGRNSKWKRPKELDLDAALRQNKSRERLRSTVFEDEIGKQERRSNRRRNERLEIDDQLEDELYLLDEVDELI